MEKRPALSVDHKDEWHSARGIILTDIYEMRYDAHEKAASGAGGQNAVFLVDVCGALAFFQPRAM